MDDRIDHLEMRVTSVEQMTQEHDKMLSRLEGNIQEVRATLSGIATHEDVEGLRAHINEQINGLLRNALNAVPAQVGTVFGGITRDPTESDSCSRPLLGC